jgi:hypothetical protein
MGWEMATCCGWLEGRRETRYSRPSPAGAQLHFAFFSFSSLVEVLFQAIECRDLRLAMMQLELMQLEYQWAA